MAYAIPAAIAGRFLLSFTSIYDSLKYDHLLTSPLTSYPRLQEGVFLYKHGIDPYSGGGFYHSPLLLSLFSTVLPQYSPIPQLLWASCDIISAYSLAQIWRLRSKDETGRRDGRIAGSYLLNPYLFLPSLALSTSSLENALFLTAIVFACRGKTVPSLFTLALLSHLSLPSVLFLPPFVMLLHVSPTSALASATKESTLRLGSSIKSFFIFAICMSFASVCNLITTGGWDWVYRTWGTGLLLPDLSPNTGLWWYFFTEMFDHFRPYFLMVFSVHLLIYVAPVCMKFKHDPLFAIFILQGLLAIFKPYPTLSDPGLFLSMISVFPEIFPYLRHPIVTALLHLHASLLLPLFHSLWLAQGTGNANFFYASTLVFGMANGAAVTDCMWAGLRVAFGQKDGVEYVQE
ncbi:PIG-U-domain-containing protein [Schizopora paradoxa]|uniref:PIG-U-domain-containing protein n=1 Tax=Schizopora paradoxa TaxID=27342 RepID=A0A0H2S7T3_9AGAM|nr:PIG-U-domain-containing protein [Schizopora paradoxa]